MMDQVNALIAARKQIEELSKPVLDSLRDTSIPLDERWEAFTALVENNILINEMSYGDGFLDTLGDNLTMYDHFYLDRGHTLTFPDMYDRIIDEYADDSLVEARQNLTEWQEQVLASGYSGFQYDW